MPGYRPKYPRAGGRKVSRLRRFLRRVTGKIQWSAGPRKRARVGGITHRQGLQEFISTRSFVLMLCLLVGATVCGWYGYRFLAFSDTFRITTIKVTGIGKNHRKEILDLGGIEIGMSLVSFDQETAARKLNSHPWINKATLVRSWPSTLEVHIQKCRPLAMVNIENGAGRNLYYVDHQGKVFAKVEKSLELDFPVMTGLAAEGIPLGTVIGKEGLAADALLFLRLAARGNPIVPLQSVSEVHVSPDKGLIIYLVDRPFPIYMGDTKIKTRYYLLVKLLERLYRKKKVKDIQEIRMDYAEDRILVANVKP